MYISYPKPLHCYQKSCVACIWAAILPEYSGGLSGLRCLLGTVESPSPSHRVSHYSYVPPEQGVFANKSMCLFPYLHLSLRVHRVRVVSAWYGNFPAVAQVFEIKNILGLVFFFIFQSAHACL